MTNQQRHKLHLFIAQKVMGWKHVKRREGITMLSQGECYVSKHCGTVVIVICDNDHGVRDTWQPTTDYAQALQVLERCGEKEPALWLCAATKASPQWAVGSSNHSGIAPTLPEAIALFARELFKQP